MKKILFILVLFSSLCNAQVNKKMFSGYSQVTAPGANTKIRVFDPTAGDGWIYNSQITGTGTSAGTTVRTFSSTVTFDVNFQSTTTQTGNISLALASSGNVEGVQGLIIVDGNSANTLSFPSTWINATGNTFDSTKRNRIRLAYNGGQVEYSISKSAIVGGGGGPSYALFDNFNRTNGSLGNLGTPSSTTWMPQVGTFSIASNKAGSADPNSGAGTSTSVFANAGSGHANGYLEADVTFPPLGSTTNTTLIFRAGSANNYMFVSIYHDNLSTGTFTLGLFQKAGGDSYNLSPGANSVSVTGGPGSTNTIRVTFSGTTINIKRNGTDVFTTTTSTTGLEGNTLFGFGYYKAAAYGDEGSTVDNFIMQ